MCMQVLPAELYHCLSEHLVQSTMDLSLVAPAKYYQICCALAIFHRYLLGTNLSVGHL